MAKNREAEVRAVGEMAHQGGPYPDGVGFVDKRQDFAEREFSAAPTRVEPLARMVLECCVGRDLVELANRDFAYGICAIPVGLARYCEECRPLTVCRHSQDGMQKKPRVVEKAMERG